MAGGALLIFKGVEKELWGGERETTNNRMELTAAIRALAELKRECQVRLVTDSPVCDAGHSRQSGDRS